MTSIFPFIESIDEFRSKVMHKEEIRENIIHDDCHAFCYMISSENTFDSPWLRECRGIVFHCNDRKPEAPSFVIGRPLHKFFNVNERPDTRVDVLDWSKVTRIMDKMDGSTIHTVHLDTHVSLKSKKAFGSDVAKAAREYARTRPNVTRFMEDVASAGATAIFEYVAPDARIVLYYPEAKLVLLHIRDNISGRYYEYQDIVRWANHFGIEVVQSIYFNDIPMTEVGNHLLELAKTVEGIEGWIVQFENGDMVKLKTEWYLKRHRAMTFLRERDIVILTLDEGLDDLKALLVGEGADITEILKIEQDVIDRMNRITTTCREVAEMYKHLDRKDFAITVKDLPEYSKLFGLIMQVYLGKEPSIKDYFERNVLKDVYTLRQLNLVQSVAEAE